MIQDFVIGGAVFLAVFLAGVLLGAWLATPKKPDLTEPECAEFSHVEGGKRVCRKV